MCTARGMGIEESRARAEQRGRSQRKLLDFGAPIAKEMGEGTGDKESNREQEGEAGRREERRRREGSGRVSGESRRLNYGVRIHLTDDCTKI